MATEDDALGVRRFLEVDALTVLLLEYFSFFFPQISCKLFIYIKFVNYSNAWYFLLLLTAAPLKEEKNEIC